MSIIDKLSNKWCFSLHCVLHPPEGTNKTKEEVVSAFASGAAGGAAAKPSTSQPPKNVVREGIVKHLESSKVCRKAARVVEIHAYIDILDAECQESPRLTNVKTVFDWLFTRWKDVTYQGITKSSSLGKLGKLSIYKGLHQQSVCSPC